MAMKIVGSWVPVILSLGPYLNQEHSKMALQNAFEFYETARRDS